MVIGTAPQLLNRGSKAIVGEPGIRVSKLYNLMSLQQWENLTSVVTSLKIKHLSHYCTKKEQKCCDDVTELVNAPNLRPRNRGLHKRFQGCILDRQVLDYVNVVFQNFNEVPPVKNIFKVTEIY